MGSECWGRAEENMLLSDNGYEVALRAFLQSVIVRV